MRACTDLHVCMYAHIYTHAQTHAHAHAHARGPAHVCTQRVKPATKAGVDLPIKNDLDLPTSKKNCDFNII